MNLFLVRHAKSESASGKKSDSEREITTEGILILKNSIEVWKNYLTKIDYIISSPILRAVQTAEQIKTGFNFSSDILKDHLLLPGSDATDYLHVIKAHKSENLILVGHQPDISDAISSFIGCENFDIPFKPASLAKITFNGKPALSRGMLEILIPPVLK